MTSTVLAVALDPWINRLVVAIFGLSIGAVLGVFGLITEPLEPQLRQKLRRPRERLSAFVLRRYRAEQQAERLPAYPRSALLAAVGFYGLIAILVVTLVLSPVTFTWWPLLIGWLGGFALARAIYRAADRGRLKIPRERLDRVFGITNSPGEGSQHGTAG